MIFRSPSEMMGSELERWRIVRRTAAIIYIVLNSVYMIYRLTIINPQSLFLSWFYFTAETFQFILGLTYIFSSWHHRRRTSPPALENASVEVWVPVYLEPIDVIRRTLSAAKRIDYPHETRVLDDGRRAEVRMLAEELGITYLSRPDNLDAKAGNLNFALRSSSADYILVFDADHIALPSAIDSMLGFFIDPKVGLVQSPQDYYNTDAFQYFNSRRTGGIWHDQSFFYLVGQPAMDHSESATCVGTGVIYRRSALQEIGGIPTDTATEDIHTSLRLLKYGWKTVFYNEPVAFGIAASNLEEYYKTRHRWAHGNLHALSLERIPVAKGMTLKQRFHHLSLGLIYLEGWQQLMLFLIPVIALLTGWQPFVITPLNVLIILFYPLISITLLQELGCGYSRMWANELFSMARWPVHIISVLGVFQRKILWKTSSKILQTQTTISRVIPQLAIFVLSAIALLVAVRTLVLNFDQGVIFSGRSVDLTQELHFGYTADILVVAGGWALYNMLRVLVFLKKAWKKNSYSQSDYRFTIGTPVIVATSSLDVQLGKTIWISEKRVRFHVDLGGNRPELGGQIDISLPLPTGTVYGVLSVEALFPKSSSYEIEGTIMFSDAQSIQRLIDALYSVFWYRDLRSNRPAFLTPFGWIKRILTGKGFQRYTILDEFAVIRADDDSFMFVTLHHGEPKLYLTSYQALTEGRKYSLLREDHSGQATNMVQIGRVDHSQASKQIGEHGRSLLYHASVS
jgi:cellulose synthase/poly-beta-1,6-N-acetylglucosamine synthase-like glycosyltransferase